MNLTHQLFGDNQIVLVLIIFGILACFFGCRAIRAMLVLTAFLVGVLVINALFSGSDIHSQTMVITIGIIAGAACAVPVLLIQDASLFLAGASLGVFLGGFLSTNTGINPLILCAVMSICTGALALHFKRFKKMVFISVTSLAGAWSIVLGATYKMGIYTTDIGVKALDRKVVFLNISSYASIEGAMKLMCWILLGILGFLVQYVLFYIKKEEKRSVDIAGILNFFKKTEATQINEKSNASKNIDESIPGSQKDSANDSGSKDSVPKAHKKVSSDLYGDIVQDYVNKLENNSHK